MTGPWTIGELAMAVQQALTTTDYSGQKSARVREVPDRRTIRYYTTLGLLDKPLEMRGRTAYYGHRHLLQLVAIKRLQSQGKSLVEIQAILTGAGSSTLAKWSALPEGFAERLDHGGVASERGASEEPVDDEETIRRRPARQADFWAVTPQAQTPPDRASQSSAANVATALHLKVLDNVTLVIEGIDADAIDAETLARLQPVFDDLKNALPCSGGRPTPKNERRNAEESGSSQPKKPGFYEGSSDDTNPECRS